MVAVSSGKGGVGKSLVASTLALTLAKKGCVAGLFDLDFTSPSTHMILGAAGQRPTEEKGVVPPVVHGLRYMSVVYYSGDLAAPLRGVDVSNALIELLCITRWGKLDWLVLDMPPGIGDATLDLLRLVPSLEFLIVTTPSLLAFETVRKLAGMLRQLGRPVVGVVENMKMRPSSWVQDQVRMLGLKYLGEIPYDPDVEESVGDVDKLMRTVFARKVGELALRF